MLRTHPGRCPGLTCVSLSGWRLGPTLPTASPPAVHLAGYIKVLQGGGRGDRTTSRDRTLDMRSKSRDMPKLEPTPGLRLVHPGHAIPRSQIPVLSGAAFEAAIGGALN